MAANFVHPQTGSRISMLWTLGDSTRTASCSWKVNGSKLLALGDAGERRNSVFSGDEDPSVP